MCTLTTQSWNQDMHRIKMKRYSIETELQPEALTGEEVASVGPRSLLALLECEKKSLNSIWHDARWSLRFLHAEQFAEQFS